MLKPMHEIATIKEGNKIDGFLVSDNRYLKEPKDFSYSHCWYVTYEDMINLVKQNKMQYFIWNDSLKRLEINYTYEEVDALYKAGIYTRQSLDDFIKRTSTLSDYIRNDMIFTRKHIELMYSGRAFAGYFVSIMKLPMGIDMVTIALVGKDAQSVSVIYNYLESSKGTKYEKLFKLDMEGNFGNITMPSICYNGFAQSINLLTNCSMLNRDKQKGVIGLVMKQGEKAKETCNMIEYNNKLVLNRLI